MRTVEEVGVILAETVRKSGLRVGRYSAIDVRRGRWRLGSTVCPLGLMIRNRRARAGTFWLRDVTKVLDADRDVVNGFYDGWFYPALAWAYGSEAYVAGATMAVNLCHILTDEGLVQ